MSRGPARLVIGVVLSVVVVAGAASHAEPKPGAGVSATFEKDAGDSGWVPLNLYLDRWASVHGTVQSLQTEISIDSGAGITVLDAGFAKKLDLALTPAGTIKGVGGEQEVHVAYDVKLIIGALTLRIGRVAVIDLSDVVRYTGKEMPVILGREAFLSTVVDLDYPGERIAFRDPEGFEYEGEGRSVPLYLSEQGLFQIEASLEDHEPARYDLDTGSGTALDVLPHYAQQRDLLGDREPRSTRLAGGVGGTYIADHVTLRSFEMAGYVLENVPAELPRVARGVFDTTAMAGNIGAGILGRFRLVFDYPHQKLHVEAGKDWNRAPFRKDRSGLQVVLADNRLEVIHVAFKSPASKSGFKLHDVIVSIDGNKVGKDYFSRLDGWQYGEAGTTVKLTDDQGRERTLVLRDYY